MSSHRQLGWVVSLATAVVAPACAGEQESLIVSHVPVWPDNGECLIDPSQDTAMLRGRLDLAFATPYVLPVVLVNQLLPQQAGSQNAGIDNSEMQLVSVDVELELPQAPELIEGLREINDALVEFQAPLATVSLPGGSRTGVAVEVISRATAIALAEDVARFQPDTPIVPGAPSVLTVIANIVFSATRTGNTSGRVGAVESRAFSFPIDVCVGCMLSCEDCPGMVCPADPIWTNFICGNAQDGPIVPAQCTDGWDEG